MPLNPAQIETFRSRLLLWFRNAKRDLPWRRTSDPYAIWISEIMLQQTRVTAAIPYYERFLARFPDFHTLAVAPEAELLAQWAGLGYYYRARNLQRAAKTMVESGRFPNSYDEIRALAGVGDYTAAAVASIGFGLAHAVVDGNVFRVLSRIANDSSDIGSSQGKKRFRHIAETLLNRKAPGEYNQALMELGATVCLPRTPQCLVCPVAELCAARAQGRQQELPVKTNRQTPVDEERTIYWIARGGEILLWQRPPDASLMPGFWELPEAEHVGHTADLRDLGSFRHGITFHNYRFRVALASVPIDIGACQWMRETDLPAIPLSTVVKKAQRLLAKKGLSAAAGDHAVRNPT